MWDHPLLLGSPIQVLEYAWVAQIQEVISGGFQEDVTWSDVVYWYDADELMVGLDELRIPKKLQQGIRTQWVSSLTPHRSL